MDVHFLTFAFFLTILKRTFIIFNALCLFTPRINSQIEIFKSKPRWTYKLLNGDKLTSIRNVSNYTAQRIYRVLVTSFGYLLQYSKWKLIPQSSLNWTSYCNKLFIDSYVLELFKNFSINSVDIHWPYLQVFLVF